MINSFYNGINKWNIVVEIFDLIKKTKNRLQYKKKSRSLEFHISKLYVYKMS